MDDDKKVGEILHKLFYGDLSDNLRIYILNELVKSSCGFIKVNVSR